MILKSSDLLPKCYFAFKAQNHHKWFNNSLENIKKTHDQIHVSLLIAKCLNRRFIHPYVAMWQSLSKPGLLPCIHTELFWDTSVNWLLSLAHSHRHTYNMQTPHPHCKSAHQQSYWVSVGSYCTDTDARTQSTHTEKKCSWRYIYQTRSVWDWQAITELHIEKNNNSNLFIATNGNKYKHYYDTMFCFWMA